MLVTIAACLIIAIIGGMIGWAACSWHWEQKESEWWDREWELKNEIIKLRVSLRYPKARWEDEVIDD